MWNPELTYVIDGEDGTRITCTTLETVVKMCERIRKDFPEETTSDTIMLPFEFIIGSLFPASYNSIKEMMTQQYIEGYKNGHENGYKEAKEE